VGGQCISVVGEGVEQLPILQVGQPHLVIITDQNLNARFVASTPPDSKHELSTASAANP
jgi:hypothetical protein